VSGRAQPGRRDILGPVRAGLGIGSALGSAAGVAHLRAQAPAAVAAPPDPDFPHVPSWTTELTEHTAVRRSL